MSPSSGYGTMMNRVAQSQRQSQQCSWAAIRLEAIAIGSEAIPSRLEAIAIRLEAIAIRLEAVAIR